MNASERGSRQFRFGQLIERPFVDVAIYEADEVHKLEDTANKLRALRDRGEDGAYLIVESGNYYVQVQKVGDDAELLVEAVSNAFLPGSDILGHRQIARLDGLGFTPPGSDSPNFSRTIRADSDDALESIATLLQQVLTEVYFRTSDHDVKINLNLGG